MYVYAYKGRKKTIKGNGQYHFAFFTLIHYIVLVFYIKYKLIEVC